MARQVRNVGRPGIAAMAISAVDIALWDLKARLLGVSLAGLPARRHDLPGPRSVGTRDDLAGRGRGAFPCACEGPVILTSASMCEVYRRVC
jgi:Mandelate racemase / muconate lactonizing enzyme, N-terminal domain